MYFSGSVKGVKLERFSRFDFLRSHIELVAILFFGIEGLWHGNFLPSIVFSIDLPGQHLAGVLYGQCSSLAAFRLGRAVQLASCFSLVQCSFLCFLGAHRPSGFRWVCVTSSRELRSTCFIGFLTGQCF